MTGLDTNVLVRYLAQDDPRQATLARRLIEGFTAEAPGFVSTVALVETVWVLVRAYGTSRADIAGVVEGLLRSRELVVQDADIHYLALRTYQSEAIDYADAVIAETGKRAGCETVTFDRRAATGGQMRLLVG